MSDYKQAKILISFKIIKLLIVYEDKAEKSTVTWYQSIVKAFIWPAIHFYLDFAYSIGLLNQFCSNPGLVFVDFVKYVLQYVFAILELSLTLDGEVNILDNIIGYTDSNFARLKINWKSTRS